MKWPWSRPTHDCRRATLTFLPNGQVVIGMPDDATPETMDHVATGLRAWLDGDRKRALVFPFPIDVIDRRYPA